MHSFVICLELDSSASYMQNNLHIARTFRRKPFTVIRSPPFSVHGCTASFSRVSAYQAQLPVYVHPAQLDRCKEANKDEPQQNKFVLHMSAFPADNCGLVCLMSVFRMSFNSRLKYVYLHETVSL